MSKISSAILHQLLNLKELAGIDRMATWTKLPSSDGGLLHECVSIFQSQYLVPNTIADVAVRKLHQRPDEIRIIYPHFIQKLLKLSHAMYALKTNRSPVGTAHACALASNVHVSHNIRLLKCVRTGGKKTSLLIPV